MDKDLPQGFENQDRAGHLRSGIVYLAAWILVAIAAYQAMEDAGGIHELLSQVGENPFPTLLMFASVLLLALAIRSFTQYFRTK